MKGVNLAEARFRALNWGIGKPRGQKGKKPCSRNKVRTRDKFGKNAAVCHPTISCGDWIPGVLRERLLPSWRAFRGADLSSQRGSWGTIVGSSEKDQRGVQRAGSEG